MLHRRRQLDSSLLIYRIHQNYISILEAFPKNSPRHNYFLACCLLWVGFDELESISKNCPHGGLIGIGNSQPILEAILSRSKVIRLHACIHDAAGYVKSTYNLGPGYVYCFGVTNTRCWNSCYFGHVSGIVLCLFYKLFKSSDYRCIVC